MGEIRLFVTLNKMADDTKTPAEAINDKTVSPTEANQTDKTDAVSVAVKTDQKPEADPATLETTTANDGNISINKPAEQVDAPTVEESVKPDLSAVSTPETPAGSSSEPVVLKPEDVQTATPDTERLQEQIESLTGEIQALEAKIERLTSGSSAASNEQTQPTPTPDKPAEPEIQKATEITKPEEKPAPKVEPAAFTPTPIPSTPTPASPVTDIYSSIGKPRPPMDPAVQEQAPHPSAVAVISEVLVILGTILFVILASTPLFREMIGEDLYQVIRSVGWLTTAATLLLGTLMAIFGKAKSAITLIGFVFLLLSAFMYIGMNYSSLLGPLESSLSTVFDFYR